MCISQLHIMTRKYTSTILQTLSKNDINVDNKNRKIIWRADLTTVRSSVPNFNLVYTGRRKYKNLPLNKYNRLTRPCCEQWSLRRLYAVNFESVYHHTVSHHAAPKRHIVDNLYSVRWDLCVTNCHRQCCAQQLMTAANEFRVCVRTTLTIRRRCRHIRALTVYAL